MLLIIRSFVLFFLLVVSSVCVLIYCIARPRHRNNVYWYARLFSMVSPLLGVKVILRGYTQQRLPCVFTANHQNSFDVFTLTKAVPRATVSLGKKSLLWMPFVGQIYWLTGNILIDRGNRQKAIATLKDTVSQMRKKMLSLWVFPEGTRSRGNGLLPFKLGAFHTAIQAKVPIIPVVASCQKNICLNRWNNGVVIVEMLKPISTRGLSMDDVKDLAEKVRSTMLERYEKITQEAEALQLKYA